LSSSGPPGGWEQTATWQAHEGSVWKVDWAHPEFGQILVSCGDDSTAQIWEEQAGSTSANRWVKKASLTDARKPVNAVALAPRHLGLRLATGGADGIVRVYEAVDVLNLESWPLSQRFDADVGSEVGVTSLSWCGARFDPPSLVVGGSSGAVKVWTFSETERRWNVAWDLGKGERCLDVKWANGVGRSFHRVAAAYGPAVRVYTFPREKKAKKHDEDDSDSDQVDVKELEVDGDVWRLDWNETGTMLATSGEDGRVGMWKADFEGVWHKVENV